MAIAVHATAAMAIQIANGILVWNLMLAILLSVALGREGDLA